MSNSSPFVPGVVIDVSKYQSALPSLVGVHGVIARAGIGTKPDPMFASHIADAKRAGRWTGSYWFNYGPLSVSEQVNAYIAREKQVGGVDLHVLDWEGATGFTAAQTAEFMRLYRQRTGHAIGLYASESRFRELGQDFNWIANYSNEPTKTYDMWQYGPFRGVDGNYATQRILSLVQEAPMPGPTIVNVQSLSGVAVVKSDAPHGAIKADDGAIAPLPGGTKANVHAVGQIVPAWPGHPSAVVYLIGDEAAWLLKEDVTFTEAKVYTEADIAAAKAQGAATQKAADQAALDKAAADLATCQTDERERIALALGEEEAQRVRDTAP